MARAGLIVCVGEGLSASHAREIRSRPCADTGRAGRRQALGPGPRDRRRDARRRRHRPGPYGRDRGGIDDRVAIVHPSARARGPLVDLEPGEVRRALDVSAFGSFVVAQAAARRMLAQGGPVRGTILFTGASAGETGFPRSAPFAMGKFAQRGLAQSMARELHPEGIHVCWVNIDGMIRNPAGPRTGRGRCSTRAPLPGSTGRSPSRTAPPGRTRSRSVRGSNGSELHAAARPRAGYWFSMTKSTLSRSASRSVRAKGELEIAAR